MALSRRSFSRISFLPRLAAASQVFWLLPRRCVVFQLGSGVGAGTRLHHPESARNAATDQVPGALSLVAFLDLEVGALLPSQLGAGCVDDSGIWLLVADRRFLALAHTQRDRRLARVADGKPMRLSAALSGSERGRVE